MGIGQSVSGGVVVNFLRNSYSCDDFTWYLDLRTGWGEINIYNHFSVIIGERKTYHVRIHGADITIKPLNYCVM